MYFEEIENYFCRKKGKSLILSPKDWILIKKWWTEGIPLPLVLQGIDAAFANNLNPKKINSIGYCESEILSLWEVYKENMVGSVRKNAEKNFNQNQKEIVQHLKDQLNEKEMAEIKRRIESRLGPYKKRMSDKTYQKTKDQLLQKEILNKFDLTNI